MDSSLEAFYRLGGEFSNSSFRGYAGPEIYDQITKASSGDEVPDSSVTIHHDSGRFGQDFLWVSLVPFISQRVVDWMVEAGATGWTAYPAQVLTKQGDLIQGYYGLMVTGKCHSARLDRSNVVYRPGAHRMFPHYRGLLLDGWDGSDFFMPGDRKTRHQFVSKRVRDLLVRKKVTNVELTAVGDVEFPATHHSDW